MNLKNAKIRKIVLLTAIAFLAAIYAVQLVTGSRSPVKNFILREKPDTIIIENSSQTVKLFYEGGLWYVGEEKNSGDDQKIEALVDALKNIKTLGTVSRSSAASELDRYGFTDSQTLTVKAEKSGKTIRTLKIGKNSETNLSSYIRLDEKPETLLADRNLRSIFEVKAEDLEQKIEQPQSEQPQAEEQTSEN